MCIFEEDDLQKLISWSEVTKFLLFLNLLLYCLCNEKVSFGGINVLDVVIYAGAVASVVLPGHLGTSDENSGADMHRLSEL